MDELIEILKPPKEPYENTIITEEHYNLPFDYLNFIGIYGTGVIANFITIFNYSSSIDDYNLFIQKKLILEDLQFLLNDDPKYYKYVLYPNENGLYPLGITDNGDYLFWVTKGEPLNWTVAVVASRTPDVEFSNYNLTDFLINVLTKRIIINAFPLQFPNNKISFEPIKS